MILKTLNFLLNLLLLSPSVLQVWAGFRIETCSKVPLPFSTFVFLAFLFHLESCCLNPTRSSGTRGDREGDTQGNFYLSQSSCCLISLGSSRSLFPLRCHFPGLFRVFSLFFFPLQFPCPCRMFFLFFCSDGHLWLLPQSLDIEYACPSSSRWLYWTELYWTVPILAHSKEHAYSSCLGLTWVPREQHSSDSASKAVSVLLFTFPPGRI